MLIDSDDLAAVVSNLGDAPRVSFPPSDYPLYLSICDQQSESLHSNCFAAVLGCCIGLPTNIAASDTVPRIPTMTIIRSSFLLIALTLLSNSLLPLREAAASTQQAGVEVDSDGDGTPDAKDRYPLIADFNLLTWEIHALRFGWSIATEARMQEQTTLTWTTGESEVKIDGNKSKLDIGAEGELSVVTRAPLNTNPFRAFGLFDITTTVEARAKAGLLYSKEMEWGIRRQKETRRAAESFAKISSETQVSNPFLSVWITFRNHSADNLVLRPSGLPVFAAGQPVVSAMAVERDGPDGSLLLPANRPEGVEVEFRAQLDNTTARQLLNGLGAGAPSIDLARSRSVICKEGGRVDAISAAEKLEGRTVEVMVSSGGIRYSWRVAAIDLQRQRSVTLRDALTAINDRLAQEFNKDRGPLFSLQKSKLTAVAAAPIRSDNGVWFASVGGHDVGKLEDWSLDQPIKMGESVAVEFKTKFDLQMERFAEAVVVYKAGPSASFAEAIVVLRELAEQGFARAQGLIGMSYYFGNGVPKDFVKAAEWYSKAAEQGNAPAQFLLGVIYQSGEGVPKDFVKAAEWYSKAAEQGNIESQCSLSQMYYQGKGVPKDVGKAAEWCRKAAEQGEARAQYNLGAMYYHGDGVPKDFVKAAEWYSKAAEQGKAPAQFALGKMYYDGDGVPKDFVKAAEWYSKAAEQGDTGSQNNLSRMYYQGEGVPKDLVRGYMWSRLAVAGGETVAQRWVDSFEAVMTKEQIAAAEKIIREFKPKVQVSE